MLRKLWLPLVVAGAAWWWTRPTAEAPPVVEDEVRTIAMSGEPLEQAMAEGRCGEMLDEVMSRPNWTLGVTTAGWSCMGPAHLVTYEIHGDGTVAYTENGLTRTLRLDPYEEAVLHDLGKLECTTPVGRHGLSMYIAPGSPPAPGHGASVREETLFGIALQTVLDRAVERRHWERLAALAPIELHVRSGKYRLSIDGETLRVHRGRRLVHEHEFFRHEFVDLVDEVIGSPARDPGRGDEIASGTLTAGGLSYPVRFSSWERGPLAPLAYALTYVEDRD